MFIFLTRLSYMYRLIHFKTIFNYFNFQVFQSLGRLTPGKVSKIKLSNVEDKVKYVAERKV